jgi:hypothetical protein
MPTPTTGQALSGLWQRAVFCRNLGHRLIAAVSRVNV